jgi:hypothetical protein
MAQVAAVLRDPERVAEIITNAYAEIALNPAYGYGTMIALFDARITEAAAGRPGAEIDERADARLRRAFPFTPVDNPHEMRRPSLARRLAGRIVHRLGLGELAVRLRRRRGRRAPGT